MSIKEPNEPGVRRLMHAVMEFRPGGERNTPGRQRQRDKSVAAGGHVE